MLLASPVIITGEVFVPNIYDVVVLVQLGMHEEPGSVKVALTVLEFAELNVGHVTTHLNQLLAGSPVYT